MLLALTGICCMDREVIDLWKFYSSLFRNCHSTGEVIVGAPGLDRDPPDGRQRYSLVVEARLGDAAAQQGIQLLLADANDNAPYFDKDQYEVSVEENIPVGKFVKVLACISLVGKVGLFIFSRMKIYSSVYFQFQWTRLDLYSPRLISFFERKNGFISRVVVSGVSKKTFQYPIKKITKNGLFHCVGS